jgi:cholesterol oxidase
MLPHIAGDGGAPGVHMLFLVGDQIYADATANVLDSRAGRERYAQKYRLAFTSPHARRVLAQLPTHFAIDDHEIADNWSGEARESHEYTLAKAAATVFQGSGRRSHPLDHAEKWDRDELWYPLSHGREHCCPTFVMDTRSERQLRRHDDGRAGRGARLTSERQLAALMRWLSTVNDGPWANMPKFIVCGVGLAPISRAFASCGQTWRSQDWWPGYPHALSDVLLEIVNKQIRHVVFVSGDLHLSSASTLTLRHKDAKPMTVWQLVSSGLYAPMPFANAGPDTYDWNAPIALPREAGCDVDLEAESALLFAGRPHFLRVDAEERPGGWTLAVGAVGGDGAFLPPRQRPPAGFVADGARWRLDLT